MKATSMRTSEDVVKHLRHVASWHPRSPHSRILVVYFERILDKRVAIKYEDFKAVQDGGDIPFTRVYQFRYITYDHDRDTIREVLLWDRDTRQDNVFGSARGNTTLDTIMAEEEAEWVRPQDSLASAAATAAFMATIPPPPFSSAERRARRKGEAPVTAPVAGKKGRHVGGRNANYFLALRVDDPAVVQGVEDTQAALMEAITCSHLNCTHSH